MIGNFKSAWLARWIQSSVHFWPERPFGPMWPFVPIFRISCKMRLISFIDTNIKSLLYNFCKFHLQKSYLMLNYCVLRIFLNHLIKSMILKTVCLHCTWHVLSSRDMYINWSKRNIWHFPFAYRHKDIVLWASKCIMIFESRHEHKWQVRLYILYRASLNFSFTCQYTFFSIHFISFIRFAYSLFRIYILYAIYPYLWKKI